MKIPEAASPTARQAVELPERECAALERSLRSPSGLIVVASPLAWLRAAVLQDLRGRCRGSVEAGRLQDPRSARRAMRLAEGGRRVIAQAACERAGRVLARLRATQDDPSQLQDALALVLAVQTLPRLCEACAQPDPADTPRRVLAVALNTWLHPPALRLLRANPGGCARCEGRGYRGRVHAAESIEIDARLRGLIDSGVPALELERAALPEGCTLWEVGLGLLACGATSLAALRSHLREPL